MIIHSTIETSAQLLFPCHLDKNDLTFLEDVTQEELYKLMKDIAGHALVNRPGVGDFSDQEVYEIGKWLRQWTRRVDTKERIITCRELRTILRKHGFDMDSFVDNHADVVRVRRPLLGIGSPKRERIMRVPYPRDGAQVGRSVLKELRERCYLTEKDRVDSEVFYSKARPADYFVHKYRGTLRSLAKT